MSDAIVVEGLVKHFGKTMALDGLSFHCPEGTVLGVLGPNGAGKTTAVRVLSTLLRPDAGRAEVFGVDVLKQPVQVREMIGLTGQYAAVDEFLTGWENLEMVGRLFRMSRSAARARADELLERFDLVEAKDRPAKTYSGGMRRRLDIAASLVAKPRVMFLDEPTTGLDPRSRVGMWSVISELVREGTSMLLTTQYLEEADQLADRIAVIDRGRLISEGTATELKDRTGGAVVELEVPTSQHNAALAALATMHARFDRGRIVLPAPQGPATLRQVLRLLDQAGIVPTDVALHRPTLDDVFLTLTRNGAQTAIVEEKFAGRAA